LLPAIAFLAAVDDGFASPNRLLLHLNVIVVDQRLDPG